MDTQYKNWVLRKDSEENQTQGKKSREQKKSEANQNIQIVKNI